MEIFSHTYVIIGLLTACFVVVGSVSIYFAAKGIQAIRAHDLPEFSGIHALKTKYEKSGRRGESRTAVYIHIAAETESLLTELRQLLLQFFAGTSGGAIALYDQVSLVAVTPWGARTTAENIEQCRSAVHTFLLAHKALNVVHVRFGSYSDAASDVSFKEAVGRAFQAYTMAVNENVPQFEWTHGSGKALMQKIQIENSIESNIENNRFFLEYQPTVLAATGEIVGAEVLSRLNSEQDGILTPGRFLSAVDSVGLGRKFDYYIFEKNCKWISNNAVQRGRYTYTVNFSRSTLCDPMFVSTLIGITKAYGLAPSMLAVEVLEDKEIGGESKRQMKQNISALRRAGILILLDDFGNGYTSFDDLQSFEVDIVKIDKQIMHNTDTKTGLIIFHHIVSMAKEMGLRIVCEGIETKKQEQTAIEAGCDMLQGFYYYRPMSVQDLEQLLAEKQSEPKQTSEI